MVLALAALAPAAHARSDDSRPLAVVAEIDGIIHPITAEFVGQALERADNGSAAVLILILRTPGGLLDSTRDIVRGMIDARTPVVVFVGPSGARAASAGFILTLAADVAVMAPGTHIGAAHPVSGTDQQLSETMSKKAAEDTAAYARTLAERRGRNVELAQQAVTESRAFTEQEALDARPPLIDFIARDLDDVLGQLEGRTIKRFDGREVMLHTRDARVERLEMTRRQRFLSTIAHPQIAYLLFSLGMLGLSVELLNPGVVFPGVVGGLCLLLAFFAFQVLPVSATGLLLIVFGLALLVLEIKFPTFGALGVGGVVSLLVGSLMLTREVPGVRVGLWTVLPTVLVVAGVVLALGRLAMVSLRRPAVTGASAMVGLRGTVVAPCGPVAPGQVAVRGETWSATCDMPLAVGQAVRVTGIEGLVLKVGPADDATRGVTS